MPSASILGKSRKTVKSREKRAFVVNRVLGVCWLRFASGFWSRRVFAAGSGAWC